MRWTGQPFGKFGKGIAVGVAELCLGQAYCAPEVGPLEMGAGEVGPLEIHPKEVDLLEMRAGEVGPLEMRASEVGRFIAAALASAASRALWPRVSAR
jgi:hypothetical protein